MKPPVGVIPRKLWLETRIQDLVRAINEYTQAGIREPVAEWSKELVELIIAREGLNDSKPHPIFPVMPSRKEEANALFNESHPPHYSEVYVNGQWGPSPIAPIVDAIVTEKIKEEEAVKYVNPAPNPTGVRINHSYTCGLCRNVREASWQYAEGMDAPKPQLPEGWCWVNGQVVCDKHRVATLIDGRLV